ncbi:DUF3800 domain-containing protein [Tessaracoccus palaemonis]|uniref:DUF3800 domain-containing protein n=1 Tax=Tessaracoccus palaemonis TaxID=2829499 RepID=A0ABX8SKP3_9ACTN|nr:DUF3800 domain-containing protein [Tessaracoccus palaemonis]QXT62718.1 DUF3800 domain-containing protein [Tessaracoccus palaemonis]
MTSSEQDTLFGEGDGEDWFHLPDDVPVSTIYIDESGARNSRGGFFVLGFIKVREPAKLDREIRHLRQKHKFFSEAKFGSINRDHVLFYYDLVELVAEADVRVGGSVYDSTAAFAARKETWRTQARMSAQLIAANINKGELVNAVIDLVQTPQGASLARVVHADVHRKLGHRALVACYDMDSQSTNLLQVADVIAGAIAYERRQWAGSTPEPPMSNDAPKGKVSARLRRALELDSFADAREGKVNILTMGRA